MVKVHFVWAAFFIAVFSACQGGEQDQPPTPSPVSPIQKTETQPAEHAKTPVRHKQIKPMLSKTVSPHNHATAKGADTSPSGKPTGNRATAEVTANKVSVQAKQPAASKNIIAQVKKVNTTKPVKIPEVVVKASTIAKTLPLAHVTAGNAGRGKRLARKCTVCHDFGPKKKVGPGLGAGNGMPGIYGRKAGASPGFKYKFTRYIKGEAWVWDDAHLAAWLCDSKSAVKTFTADTSAKTKMPKQKICDPDSQADIIAYLKTL